MDNWDQLKFWKSGEWDAIEEKLDELDKSKKLYNPSRDCIFKAFKETPLEKVKVCLMGQDPYPNPRYATGLAFSIPPGVVPFPPTLQEIINEYKSDLGYPEPRSGDLTEWCKEGVLLWNVIPTCNAWHSMSHDWPEWEVLTREVVKVLSLRGIVFCALGARARKYLHPETEIVEGHEWITKDTVDPKTSKVIELANPSSGHEINYKRTSVKVEYAHPSPRNKNNPLIKNPFHGSKMFSRINLELVEIGFDPIDWRL